MDATVSKHTQEAKKNIQIVKKAMNFQINLNPTLEETDIKDKIIEATET